jgi:peptidyl-tRNA hydrolase
MKMVFVTNRAFDAKRYCHPTTSALMKQAHVLPMHVSVSTIQMYDQVASDESASVQKMFTRYTRGGGMKVVLKAKDGNELLELQTAVTALRRQLDDADKKASLCSCLLRAGDTRLPALNCAIAPIANKKARKTDVIDKQQSSNGVSASENAAPSTATASGEIPGLRDEPVMLAVFGPIKLLDQITGHLKLM